MSTRFQDDGRTLWSFTDDILVTCPMCGACAHVLPKDRRDLRFASPRRVSCLNCGYARDGMYPRKPKKPHPKWSKAIVRHGQRFHISSLMFTGTPGPTKGAPTVPITGPKEPYTGLPLYLQTPCAGHTFWALNARHLTWIADFLAADLREDASPARRKTALSILPQWLILAKHRDEAQRAIARLRDKLLA
jgi:hypothetical protein